MKTRPKAQRRFRRAAKKPSVRRVMDEDDVVDLFVCGEESTEIK